ncbi:MAG: bifunctional riboflavin kinase/FMN adenylyltransferase [Firmicutes bacterium ADurb.Bin373]|nr:MAG: bifunctional riboflavin kinase/FMN adenylyltransferase [Firmicutes bacterium ADurb.Bin373]
MFFLKKIRDEKRFSSVEELIKQIRLDREQAGEIYESLESRGKIDII